MDGVHHRRLSRSLSADEEEDDDEDDDDDNDEEEEWGRLDGQQQSDGRLACQIVGQVSSSVLAGAMDGDDR